MPRYYFDIHAGSLSEWDDDGAEADDSSGAVAHAKYIIAVALGDISRRGGDRHVIVTIRDKFGKPLAALTGVEGSEPRVILPGQIEPD